MWQTKLATRQAFYCTLNTQYRIVSYRIVRRKVQKIVYTSGRGAAPSGDDASGVSWKHRVIHADRLCLVIELDTRAELN